MQLPLLPPLRIKLHEDDHEKYGSDWYIYDEVALTRLPVGELRDIERAIDMSIPVMIERSRRQHADATLAQMWIARRMAGVTEPFADFAPLVFLADWEVVDQAKDADPPDSGSSAPRAAPKRSSSGTSRSSRSSSARRRAS